MVKSLKSKKRKMALTLFYYVSREIWLGYVSREIWLDNSEKFICRDQSRLHIFSHPQEFKNV